MITTWNDTTLTLVRKDLTIEINKVMAKHGLLPVAGINFSYSANKATAKLDLFVDPTKFTGGNQVTNQEALMLKDLGIPLGTKIQSRNNGVCTVIGYKSRSKKYPIIARNELNQTIGFPAFGIKNFIIALPDGSKPTPTQTINTLIKR